MRASRANVAGLHDTATTTGTLLRGELARLRLARPGAADRTPRRRSARAPAATNGRRNRSRRCAVDRLEAVRRRRGALERGDRGLVAVGRGDARALGEPQRERADAAEQVGDCFARRAMRRDQPRQRCLACGGRLQERARRQRHASRAHRARSAPRAARPARRAA